MKILAVIALLFSLCVAIEDFTIISVANSTQCYSTYYPDSKGTCTMTITYTSATNTLAGSYTCTGLNGNVTAVHFHDVGTSASVTYYTGNPISDCSITADISGNSGSFSCKFADMVSMNALCADQLYLNYHSTYDTSGEVRSNLVNMAPCCAVKGGVALDGNVVIVTDAPKTGVTVDSFYIGGFVDTPVGSGYFYISWNSVTQTVIVSGILYGQSSSISTIYLYYPFDGSSSLGISSYYTFPVGCPFSFKSSSVSLWTLAKLASGQASVNVTLTDGTAIYYLVVSATSFPKDSAPCIPYVTVTKPSAPLTCQYGSSDTTTIDNTCYDDTYFCAVYPYSNYNALSCSSYYYCYSCACTATSADLPAGGYVCCDTNNCNLLGFAGINCLIPKPSSSAGNLSVGFLISLCVVVFMKWF